MKSENFLPWAERIIGTDYETLINILGNPFKFFIEHNEATWHINDSKILLAVKFGRNFKIINMTWYRCDNGYVNEKLENILEDFSEELCLKILFNLNLFSKIESIEVEGYPG